MNIGDSGLGIDAPVWFDPDVAVGYDFTVAGAGVTGLSLPDVLGTFGSCQIWYDDGSGPVFLSEIDPFDGTEYFDWYPGGIINFPFPVNVFGITGIDTGLELDPLDPTAFPVGLIFDGPANDVTVTMTPIAIPEPATISMLALGGLMLIRRR